MKHKTSGYSKTFLLPNGEWEKIWHEVENEEGDDPRKNLYEARKIVTNFHFESNGAEKKADVIQALTPEGQIKQYKIEIAVADAENLKTFEFLSKKFPEIKEAVGQRKKELEK